MSHEFNKLDFIKTLPHKPGIYQMFDVKGTVIYVGKAKDLKKRVTSYFRENGLDEKSKALMGQMARIEVTITADENEALLLENNLIKQFRPHYNILFKDDKSFPYLFLSESKYPRLSIYRGAKDTPGEYFGPYPAANVVHETLHLSQKIFMLRSCNDTYFRYRTRPCLQYQIKRCSAPCVGYITEENYKHDCEILKQLLRGKNKLVIDELSEKMLLAAKNKQYELASIYRDKLANLKSIQIKQRVIKEKGDIDVIALAFENNVYCLQILSVRFGAVIGSRAYFPSVPEYASSEGILATFLERNYFDFTSQGELPNKILVNVELSEKIWFEAAFQKKLNQKIKIISKTSNQNYKLWLKMAENNAMEAISRHVLLEVNLNARFKALQKDLVLEKIPQKIECFDISHKSGEATVGVCVVFTQHGPDKNAYRRFNITDITPGDDYAALREAILRHYEHLEEQGKERYPDILSIDGGKGQLHIAASVLKSLRINEITILAIAKDRTESNKDIIYRALDSEIIIVEMSQLALHLLMQVRDETHRFAITSHRRRYAKSRRVSALESIPGIGAKRRAQLLKYFQGLQGIKEASIEELNKVEGINLGLAEQIYKYFHP